MRCEFTLPQRAIAGDLIKPHGDGETYSEVIPRSGTDREIQFSILSVAQSAFCEAFFPITLLTKDQSSLDTTFSKHDVRELEPLTAESKISEYQDFDSIEIASAVMKIRLQNMAVSKLCGEQPLYAIEGNGGLIAPYYRTIYMSWTDLSRMFKVLDDIYTESGLAGFLDRNREVFPGTPTVVIGTTPLVLRFFYMRTGIDVYNFDPPILGRTKAGLKIQMVSTLDYRVENKAFISFKFPDKSPTEPHALTFGHTVWAPPKIETIHNRNRGLVRDVFTPRAAIVTHLPILVTINFDHRIESEIGKRM